MLLIQLFCQGTNISTQNQLSPEARKELFGGLGVGLLVIQIKASYTKISDFRFRCQMIHDL
jgi:hypothetical protein